MNYTKFQNLNYKFWPVKNITQIKLPPNKKIIKHARTITIL